MSEGKKKMDPYQLIALIVIVGSVFTGLYYTNMIMVTRFDTMEATLSSNASTLETVIKRLDEKVKSLEDSAAQSAAARAPAAPADEADAEAAGEAGEAVAKAEGSAEPPAPEDAVKNEAKGAAAEEAVAKADKKPPEEKTEK